MTCVVKHKMLQNTIFLLVNFEGAIKFILTFANKIQ
jgi:hypothetical protein